MTLLQIKTWMSDDGYIKFNITNVQSVRLKTKEKKKFKEFLLDQILNIAPTDVREIGSDGEERYYWAVTITHKSYKKITGRSVEETITFKYTRNVNKTGERRTIRRVKRRPSKHRGNFKGYPSYKSDDAG